MKNLRQQKILELIEEYDIDTQESLLFYLEKCGFNVTQATVSRDIKQLKLVKGMSGRGTYKYILPTVHDDGNSPVFNSAFSDSVIHVENARNIVVVRTYSGMANAVAACIDTLQLAEIVGSVAGDDTIIIVVRDDNSAAMLSDKFKKMFRA